MVLNRPILQPPKSLWSWTISNFLFKKVRNLPLSKSPNSMLAAVCCLTRAFISSAVHSSSSTCCSLNSFSVSMFIPCMLWISGLEVWGLKPGCLACFDCLCCCCWWLVVMQRTVGPVQTRISFKWILCKEVICRNVILK